MGAHPLNHIEIESRANLQPAHIKIDLKHRYRVQLALIVPFRIVRAGYQVERVSRSVDFGEGKVHLLSIDEDGLGHDYIVRDVKKFEFSLIECLKHQKVPAVGLYSVHVRNLLVKSGLDYRLALSEGVDAHDATRSAHLLESQANLVIILHSPAIMLEEWDFEHI